MMPSWRFKCYLDEEGHDVINEWLDDQPDALQAKVETRIRFLQQRERHEWVRPYFDTLHGDCNGIGELRLEFKNVQYRILGFASGAMEYTWLMITKEIGGSFVPKNACADAQKRKALVTADRRRARDCEFD
jgi:hypothetical protein